MLAVGLITKDMPVLLILHKKLEHENQKRS